MDETSPRAALVAGGTGALGSAVVARLLAEGDRVVVPYVVTPRRSGCALRSRMPSPRVTCGCRAATSPTPT